MAKQKKVKVRRSRKHHAAYWLLLTIGVVAAGFAVQAIALWLPWRWAYGFAANATVWSIAQLGSSVLVILVAMGFFYIMRRTTAIVFGVIGVVTIAPMIQLFVTLGLYAQAHGVTLDVFEQRHLVRGVHAPTDNVAYAQINGQPLMLSVYKNHDIAKRSPAVVYVHGGGWRGGSRTENGELVNWLNGQGYTVFSIDYRYARAHYASWQDAPRDVACALAWLGRNADAQQIDADDVTIMGDSAGGQLALRAAYGVKSGDVSPSCPGQPIVPKKIIAIVPAIDFRELYDDPRLGPTSRKNVVKYLGGTPDSVPQAYDESTIITHVKAGLQPTLIINAANDTLVSPDSGEKLAASLRSVGVEAQQYTIPYAVHSYWINPGGYQNQTVRGLVERFLDK